MTSRFPLACSSRKRRTSALLFSSTEDIEASSSSPTPVSLLGRHHEHDATRRALAHRLEPYSPKLVDEGPRGSILLIPSTLSTHPLEGVAEALRSHSRRSQKMLEVYSLLALNLVREPASPTSASP